MFGSCIGSAQPFVNRSGDVGDVLADACGIALGCAAGIGLLNDHVNYTVN